MTSRAPDDDIDEARLAVRPPKRWAAGVPSVALTLKRGVEQMGPRRALQALRRLNQHDGYDCPGCAWPEPSHRTFAEFCENGAKAVAEEATLRRVGPDFFAAHPVAELAERTEFWLGQQGRLTHPVVLRPGATHYEPIAWDDAFDLIAARLRGLVSPDRAVFYTSGRTSNEAAFVYQLFVRAYGTNNLPDCSNMCHESSGVALGESIGVGKGSIVLDDLARAELIFVVGQNPGTNHPRMLSALESAKRAGAAIVAVNPLPEAGLLRFRNPQTVRGLVGGGTPLADEFLQIRVGGDQALFQALGHLLLAAEAAAPGTVLDHAFLADHVDGLDAYADHVGALDWDAVTAATGLARADIERVADRLARSRATIVCWAMGLTQQKGAVATIQEIVNVLLLQGNLGRPGAGVCPVRGHSNVQGDRTMGIWERADPTLLDALQAEFGFDPSRHDGLDAVDAIGAMARGEVDVFMAMGGNFVSATPDTTVTEAALRRCGLTVHVSTKLNRSHVVTGATALILPALGRTERDVQAGGEQFVTVEDSMSVVHRSQGRLDPPSPEVRSEVAIVCGLAERVLAGRTTIPWHAFAADYEAIRDRIARVIPGCEDYGARVRQPDGFVLPHPPRDERRFPTASGRARLAVNPLEVLRVPPGRLLLQTVRSHDQYNTTIYGLDDRYRGVKDGRRVVFVHTDDLAERGLADGDLVDLVSEWPTADGTVTERRGERFRCVAYDTPRGCAAAYFPEANVLVPLEATADRSHQPVSKAIIVRLEPSAAPVAAHPEHRAHQGSETRS